MQTIYLLYFYAWISIKFLYTHITTKIWGSFFLYKERWMSGRSQLTANESAEKSARGFKSRPLRHQLKWLCSSAACPAEHSELRELKQSVPINREGRQFKFYPVERGCPKPNCLYVVGASRKSFITLQTRFTSVIRKKIF